MDWLQKIRVYGCDLRQIVFCLQYYEAMTNQKPQDLFAGEPNQGELVSFDEVRKFDA